MGLRRDLNPPLPRRRSDVGLLAPSEFLAFDRATALRCMRRHVARSRRHRRPRRPVERRDVLRAGDALPPPSRAINASAMVASNVDDPGSCARWRRSRSRSGRSASRCGQPVIFVASLTFGPRAATARKYPRPTLTAAVRLAGVVALAAWSCGCHRAIMHSGYLRISISGTASSGSVFEQAKAKLRVLGELATNIAASSDRRPCRCAFALLRRGRAADRPDHRGY